MDLHSLSDRFCLSNTSLEQDLVPVAHQVSGEKKPPEIAADSLRVDLFAFVEDVLPELKRAASVGPTLPDHAVVNAAAWLLPARSTYASRSGRESGNRFSNGRRLAHGSRRRACQNCPGPLPLKFFSIRQSPSATRHRSTQHSSFCLHLQSLMNFARLVGSRGIAPLSLHAPECTYCCDFDACSAK